ncbi:hypothetical protein HY214_03775 [Candidatus Roizmanbacteria bacterium]|nr:hypothetical protein [Candidatus Roizmanbacteria bacterium]
MKGPEKRADGKWRVRIYNPAHSGPDKEYDEELNVTEDWQVYQQRRLQELKSKFDPVSKKYDLNKPGDLVKIFLPQSELDGYLFREWFNAATPPGKTALSNALAGKMLLNGAYDLALADDPQLPPQAILGKLQNLQFDGKNCVPLTFFSAAIRYAAKPGDNDFKRKGIQQFYDDFGISILTREELLQPATSKPSAGALSSPRNPNVDQLSPEVRAATSAIEQQISAIQTIIQTPVSDGRREAQLRTIGVSLYPKLSHNDAARQMEKDMNNRQDQIKLGATLAANRAAIKSLSNPKMVDYRPCTLELQSGVKINIGKLVHFDFISVNRSSFDLREATNAPLDVVAISLVNKIFSESGEVVFDRTPFTEAAYNLRQLQTSPSPPIT